MMSNVVFTLGTGRCGTRTIANLFATLPGVRSYHEGQPDLCDAAHARMTGTKYPVAQDIHEKRKIGMLGVAHFHDSAMWYTWLIPDVVVAFPQAKFIWLTRDLFSWARSAHRRGWYDPHVERLRSGMVQIRPRVPWSDRDRWFKLGYMWQVYQLHTMDILSQMDNPWIQFSTNDLNDLTKVNALACWCGFPGTVKKTTHDNGGDAYVTCREVQQTELDFAKQVPENMLDVPLTVSELIGSEHLPSAAAHAKRANEFVRLPVAVCQSLADGVVHAQETWQ